MKKFLKVFSVLLAVVLLTGCSVSFNLGNTTKKDKEKEEQTEEKEEKKEEKKETKENATCYRHVDDYTESYYMLAKNNKIYEVDFTMVYDKENNIADFTTYTAKQKEVFIESMYEHLGVEKGEEGLDVEVKITDTLEVYIKADLDKADKDKLNKLGFYFDSVDRELDRAVKNFKSNDYLCS